MPSLVLQQMERVTREIQQINKKAQLQQEICTKIGVPAKELPDLCKLSIGHLYWAHVDLHSQCLPHTMSDAAFNVGVPYCIVELTSPSFSWPLGVC